MGALNRKWVFDCVPASPPTHPSENCFMHHTEKAITLEDRLDRACEPGVDYGEWGTGQEARKRCTHACLCVSSSVKAGVVLAACGDWLWVTGVCVCVL